MGAVIARERHRALPFDTWPEADRAAWDASNQSGGLFEDGGKAATWRSRSRLSCMGAYSRWLGWLVIVEGTAMAEAPAARITPARMAAYVMFLQETCAPFTVASYLGVLCMVVVALMPTEDWAWLRRAQAKLHRSATPTRDKPGEIVSSLKLGELGSDLMDASRGVLHATQGSQTTTRATNKAARDFRDGLIIALLAQRPLRVGNLLQTQIGKHLQIHGTWVTLQYTKDETKHKRELAFVWPEKLKPALHEYLEIARPLLIRANIPNRNEPAANPNLAALWIAQGGTALGEAALYKALKRHTLSRFGRAVVAQRFRDCGATTMVNLNPNHVRYAQRLLGHTSSRTTERHYIEADGQLALKTLSDLVDATRAKLSNYRRLRLRSGGYTHSLCNR